MGRVLSLPELCSRRRSGVSPPLTERRDSRKEAVPFALTAEQRAFIKDLEKRYLLAGPDSLESPGNARTAAADEQAQPENLNAPLQQVSQERDIQPDKPFFTETEL